jgi:hypothetical protein
MVAAALLAGCGSEPPSELGILAAAPSLVDFGLVPLEGAGRKTVIISNRGSGPVTIGGLTLSADLAGELSVDGLPARIAAQDEATIDLVFEPRARGTRMGTLAISLSGATTQTLEIAIRAAIESSSLTVVPDRVDLGRVQIGATKTATVLLENRGDRDETIVAASFDPGSSPAFSVALGAVRRIPPGRSAIVSVRYQPTAPGREEARIIFSDGASRARASLPLAAEAIASSIAIEPRLVDFHAVPIGIRTERELSLVNLTTVRQRIRSVQIAGDGEAFEVVLPPEPIEIEPASSVRFVVRFLPIAARAYAGDLEVESESDGIPVGSHLQGSGASQGEGAIVIAPFSIDFGPIEAGRRATFSAWIIAVGSAPAEIDPPRIEPSNAPFFAIVPHAIPSLLEPGDRSRVDLVLVAPESGAIVEADLVVPWRSGESTGEVHVRARGEGATGPIPRLFVSEYTDFGVAPVGRTQGRVILAKNAGTATLTIDRVVLEDDAQGRFSLAPFSAVIEPGEEARIPISFTETSGPGIRSVRLLVTSDDPFVPMRRVAGSVSSIFPQSSDQLGICVSWSEPDRSIDLLVAPSDAAFFDAPRSLAYCNPSADLGRRGDPFDDPILIRDAFGEIKEECADLSAAPSGRYSVAVDSASDDPTDAALEVSLAGLVRAHATRRLAGRSRWLAGTIDWDRASGLATFEPAADPLSTSRIESCF